ncbi:alpha/beta fold hydrolase [Mesorhizobium sp. WSM2561]|uniref:alpha/beta fold hydrolase n=1 Tax=Mesorhizobium sp. WSM2561 TaxID=1040985 RepID=UPI00048374C0|nr:alpha/beta fold hydrolase [Mesorhizobium sp. WSM2561]
MAEFTPDTSLLIGILADVSMSMRGSIGSSGASAINRLEAFSEALEDMVKQAAASVQDQSQERPSTEVRLFAYGFGFGNPLSAFLGRQGPDVRDLFAPNGIGERTLDVVDLASNWQQHLANVRSLTVDMFGSTPMRAALERAKARFLDEIGQRPAATTVLFVLSDGEPTDGDPETILAIADEIRSLGATIVSCFVTKTDITEPQRLYGGHLPSWPPEARLMFDCASELRRGTTFDAQLREYGWRIDAGSHLFAQVNQSEMLSEFLTVAVSPLREIGAATANGSEPIDFVAPRPPPPTPKPERPRTPKPCKARLLFLHGLGGNAEMTWGRLPEFLMADVDLAERYVAGFFSFPTTLFRLPLSARAPKIQELAKGLRTQIEHDEFERVDLVCHSLGGLIARRYLIEEVKAKRPLRVERVALLAVPNNGAGLASAAQFVSWRQNQIKQLCKDADIIEFLNEDWFQFDVQHKVKTKFIVGTQDEVVDRYSVAGYWGNLDVETIIGRGHIDLVKPERADDLVVKVLRRFLVEGTPENGNLTNNDLRFLLAMEDGENRLPEQFQALADKDFGYEYEHGRREQLAIERLGRLLTLHLVERVGGSEYRISAHGMHVLHGIKSKPGSYKSVLASIKGTDTR